MSLCHRLPNNARSVPYQYEEVASLEGLLIPRLACQWYILTTDMLPSTIRVSMTIL